MQRGPLFGGVLGVGYTPDPHPLGVVLHCSGCVAIVHIITRWIISHISHYTTHKKEGKKESTRLIYGKELFIFVHTFFEQIA